MQEPNTEKVLYGVFPFRWLFTLSLNLHLRRGWRLVGNNTEDIGRLFTIHKARLYEPVPK